MKTNKKIKESLRLTDGARGQRGPLVSETETKDGGWPAIAHRRQGLQRWGYLRRVPLVNPHLGVP